MNYIQHRINTVYDYSALNLELISGVECDVRHFCGEPYLNHDVAENSEDNSGLSELISAYVNPYIILNFKETGKEIEVLYAVKKKIPTPLLLDVPFPVVIKAYNSGFGQSVMWRMSEYEKPALNLIKDLHGEWIWLDSFHSYWFDGLLLEQLKSNGCTICLVSNELQHRRLEEGLDLIVDMVTNGLIDFICTKAPEKYAQILSV